MPAFQSAVALARGPLVPEVDAPWFDEIRASVEPASHPQRGDARRGLGLAVLLITHDLGVVAEACDRVVVMHAGRVVETAAVGELFLAPVHPYTRELLDALPRLGARLGAGEGP